MHDVRQLVLGERVHELAELVLGRELTRRDVFELRIHLSDQLLCVLQTIFDCRSVEAVAGRSEVQVVAV